MFFRRPIPLPYKYGRTLGPLFLENEQVLYLCKTNDGYKFDHIAKNIFQTPGGYHPDNVVYTEVVNPCDVFWEEIEGLSRDEAIEYMLNDRVEDLWANSPLAEHGEF